MKAFYIQYQFIKYIKFIMTEGIGFRFAHQQTTNGAGFLATALGNDWDTKFSSLVYMLILMLVPAIYLFTIHYALLQRNFRLFTFYREEIDNYSFQQRKHYNQYKFTVLFFCIVAYDIALLTLGFLAVFHNYWNRVEWLIYVTTCILGGFAHLLYSVCRNYSLLAGTIVNWLYILANMLLYIEMYHSIEDITPFMRNLQSFRVGIVLLFALHCTIQYLYEPTYHKSWLQVPIPYIITSFAFILVFLVLFTLVYGPHYHNIGYIIAVIFTSYGFYEHSKLSQIALENLTEHTNDQ